MKKLGFFLLLLSFSSLNAQVINSVYKAQTYDELAAPIREATRALNDAEDKLVTYYEKAISAIKNQDYSLAKLYIDKCYELNRRFNGNLCSQEDLNKLSDYYQQQCLNSVIAGAKQGNAVAEYLLGMLYVDGYFGFPKDENKAKYWLNKAAQQGDKKAKEELEELEENNF
jgi:TPR repeat protein